MITLYVKKIWSLNPTKYKYMTLEKATKEYNEYLGNWQGYILYKSNPKTFKNWLQTEI